VSTAVHSRDAADAAEQFNAALETVDSENHVIDRDFVDWIR